MRSVAATRRVIARELLECTCYTAVVTIDLSNSGVRCKPSSYSSAAVRQLCHHQREATSISGGSFAGHTTAASCERRAGFTSIKKRHVPTYLSSCPLLPFCWPSRPRKSYFHQVKPNATRTDGGLNKCGTYRRSRSNIKKSPLPPTHTKFKSTVSNILQELRES